jgi:hypothetical protein
MYLLPKQVRNGGKGKRVYSFELAVNRSKPFNTPSDYNDLMTK